MKPSVLVKYGHTIKHRRIRMDLTQTALAQQVGISRNYLGLIESGNAPDPSFRIMIDLWKAVGLSMSDRLEDYDDIQIFTNAICPHCGGSIRLTLAQANRTGRSTP